MLVIDGKSLLEPFQSRLQLKTPGLIDFGVVDTNSGEQRKSIVVQNTGSEPLTISGLSIVGPQSSFFSIAQDSGESVLQVGEERVLEVDFDPAWKGRFGAALQISVDSETHNTRFGLSGSGVEENLIQPNIKISVIGDTSIIETLSQFGVEYSLKRAGGLPGDFMESIQSQLGTGEIIYFIDAIDTESFEPVFYQTAVQR